LRTFRRRLFASVSVLSLICCLVTAGLWVRSYWREDAIFVFCDPWFGDHDGLLFSSASGRIYGAYAIEETTSRYPSFSVDYSDATSIPYVTKLTVQHRVLGAGISLGGGPATNSGYGLRWAFILPHAAACAAFGALPVAWAWRFERTRRRRFAGLCLNCGYDLRATPERCPECGRDVGASRV
jgi:hypothetical protein